MSEPYSPGESRLYDNDPRSKRFSSGSTRGLMDGAAQPGQSLPVDKQQTKIKDIQAEVIDARIAIQDTLTKLQERGELMDELQGKTDNLSVASKTFRTSATKTRRRMWLQNAKWTICLSIFILLILAGVIAGAVKGSQVAKEKVVEKITSLTASATAMPATSSITSVSSGVASVVTTMTGAASGAMIGAGKPS